MKPLRALILGRSAEIAINLLDILTPSGFEIDCLLTRKSPRLHPSINKYYYVKTNEELLQQSFKLYEGNDFDFIIPTDDLTIKLILDSDFSLSYKEKFLPVINRDYFSHLSSKIGLSKVLKESKIPTPEFDVVNNDKDILDTFKVIGFPFMLKGDFSGAGNQTIEVNNQDELDKKITTFNFFPAVIQKKIDGDLISIEALFMDTKLIHFSYAKVLETEANSKFTPSVVREYSPLEILDEEIFQEISALGVALGVNGFVNISCIHSHTDNQHYYFEADVRPTSWIGYTKHFGDDLGVRLKDFLTQGQVLLYPVRTQPKNTKVILPYYLRFTTFDILTNRYSVWKYIPKNRIALYWIIKKHILRNIEKFITLRPLRRKLFKRGH